MTTVQITTHCEAAPVDHSKLETLVETVCERFGLSDATVSVGVVDDAEIAKLNQEFLSHTGPTDCLSFDLSDASGPHVFDLIVNGQMAIRQAAERGHSGEAELALYVTHGLLHQLGFDDQTAQQARKMHATEDEILQHLGYGFVYNDGPKRRPTA
jgi:probable rRNA maturation factor